MSAQSEATRGKTTGALDLEAPIGKQVNFKLKMDKAVVWGKLSCEGTKATLEIFPLNSRQSQKMSLESIGEESIV